MTCYSPSCKAMFGSLAVMGIVWLLLVNGSYHRGVSAAAGMGTGKVTATATMAAESGGIFRETELVGGSKVVHPKWHLNYMSKRRVPNGPDPIHNRRAGNSGRPPGKA